jgi:hypothetical protein
MNSAEIVKKVESRWLRACELVSLLKKDDATFPEKFRNLIKDYDSAINETAAAMRRLGVWDECARCGRSAKGSCCAPEVALWYDVETLAINVLMGCDFPSSPFYPDHCLFLGEKGCLLRARHYFCVHFLCPTLEQKLGSETKNFLLKTVGKELLIGSEVISWLNRYLGKLQKSSHEMSQ